MTSDEITLSAKLPAGTAIGIVGGKYSVNGGAFTDQPGTVNPGDRVRLRVTASDQYSTAVSATLTVGKQTGTFTVTTKAAPDTTPDPFSFTPIVNAKLNQPIASNPITVSGIEAPAEVSITGGSYSRNGAAYTQQPGQAQAGDKIRVRLTSADQYDTARTATLTIGGVSADFRVTTQAAPADATPDPFQFTAATRAKPGQPIISNPITVGGINVPANISIVGGGYSINGNPFTNQPGQVDAGDRVRVRVTASDQYNTATTATLTIGGVKGTFRVTTQSPPPDTTPDPFDFSPVSGAELKQIVTSEAVAITGINTAAPVQIQGGSYSINGKPFTKKPGKINAGDQVRVRLAASAQYDAATTATLTIGGVSGAFSVTTRQDPVSCATSSGWAGAPTALELPLPSSSDKSYGQSLAATCQWLWVGAPQLAVNGQKNRGGVYWWRKTADGTWKVNPSSISQGAAGDGFGGALAIDAEWAAVGAPRTDLGIIQDFGKVYLYRAQKDDWQPAQELITPDYQQERFGSALALSGHWLAIGAPGPDAEEADVDTHGDGAVYLYSLQQGAWVHRQTLASPNPGGRFGASLALEGERLIVGAPVEYLSINDNLGSGAVHAYRLDGELWIPDDSFPLPELGEHLNGQFGTALALQGDILAVSAPTLSLIDPSIPGVIHASAGRVFLYRWDAAARTWRLGDNPLQEKGARLAADNRFGSSLALADQGQWLLVGAPGADPAKTLGNAGRGYLYQLAGFGGAIAQTFEGTTQNQGLGRAAALLPNAAFLGAKAGQVWSYRAE